MTPTPATVGEMIGRLEKLRAITEHELSVSYEFEYGLELRRAAPYLIACAVEREAFWEHDRLKRKFTFSARDADRIASVAADDKWHEARRATDAALSALKEPRHG